VKRAALYACVSTSDQSCETQLLDLRQLAEQRGFTVIEEFIDHGISGIRAKRPGLDRLLADTRRGKFDVLLVWSFDRLARSVRHLVEVLEELSKLSVEFISFREAIDTSGPLGRALVVIVGASANWSAISSSNACAPACAGPSSKAGNWVASPSTSTMQRSFAIAAVG
jgi:DNA invertase Pin-like site-specific DNA recombinase